jgi:hypothetical protein
MMPMSRRDVGRRANPARQARRGFIGTCAIGACAAVAMGRDASPRIAGAAEPATMDTPLPESMRSWFNPPADAAGQAGAFRSPLVSADGRRVASAAEWPARRAEILRLWHAEMGPWPELLDRPRTGLGARRDRGDGVVEHFIEVEVAPGVMQHGYLLVPHGASLPAVLVPYYAPEVSVATGATASSSTSSRWRWRRA